MVATTRIWRSALFGLLAAGLSACGGETVTGQRVLFSGSVDAADYIGQTFPVFVLIGETGDPTGSSIVGEGSVTYNTDGSLTLRLPGAPAIQLTEIGTSGLGTSYRGIASGTTTIDVLVSDFSSTDAFRLLTTAQPDLSILGGFGFETAVADRPASGTYATAGAVFLTTENVGAVLPAAGTGSLVADFTNGSITGTLLDTDPVSVALAGDVSTPDDLALNFFLESGVITTTGFRGDVSVTGELVVDGAGAPVALNTSVTGDRASGAFFGDGAEAIGGTFEANVGLSDGVTPLVDLEAGGLVTGTRTGP